MIAVGRPYPERAEVSVSARSRRTGRRAQGLTVGRYQGRRSALLKVEASIASPGRSPRREDVVAKFHITVHGADRAAMADIVRVHGVRVYGQTLKGSGAGFQVDGVGDDAVIGRLTKAGYRVDRHEDLDESARESLRDVGTGNRFAAEAAAALRDVR
jgi:hypothetical protein